MQIAAKLGPGLGGKGKVKSAQPLQWGKLLENQINQISKL